MRAPMMRPPRYSIFRNLPKREELSFRTVFALPNASKNGLHASTFFSIFTWDACELADKRSQERHLLKE
jgi:hypothetical protein